LEARLPSFFAPDFNSLHGDGGPDGPLARLQYALQLAIQAIFDATDKQKEYFDKRATHHVYHEGQFVLMEDFNFLIKNCKLVPQFSGPFHILRVKGPHNVKLLLTNGHKIVVNITRIKPYLSSETSPRNVIQAAPSTLPAGTPTFDPPLLTLAYSCWPGRPCKNFAEEDDYHI
jgi:hypothetical protein